MHVSVTELGSWRRCHRAWAITSQNGEGLARVDTVPTQFSIGTALHLAFSSHQMQLDPLKITTDYLVGEETSVLDRATKAGFADDELVTRLVGARELSVALVQHYFDYWGWDNPLASHGLKYIATEITLQAPILGYDAADNPDDPDAGTLVGTLDGIATDDDGKYYIVEHKSYSQKPRLDEMSVNDQATAYAWLFWQVFGIRPEGFLYDGVAKKLPTIPRMLKDGTMSKQWIDTTAAVYVNSLLANGLNPDDYDEFLARLQDRDQQEQNPFFTRGIITIPARSLRTFEKSLTQQYREMLAGSRASHGSGVLYPNFRWEGCWDCSVRDLCKAIQFEEDYDYLRDTFYRRSEGHASVKNIKLRKGDLASPLDLQTSWVPGALKHLVKAHKEILDTNALMPIDIDL